MSRQMSFTVLDDGSISADFGKNLEPLVLNPSEVPEEIQHASITEGMISRARAYTSKLVKEDRTPEKLREVIGKAFDNLRNGVWKVERVAGEGSYTQEVQAALLWRVMRATAKGETCADTLADVQAAWDELSDDQRKAVKATPRFQQALAEVKAKVLAERAAKLAEKADAEDSEKANDSDDADDAEDDLF